MSHADPLPPDRRALLKERHRRAIIDAGAALIEERDGVRFTVDELAERADVSRRTVFNHFGTLDDVVVAVCNDVLGGLVERFLDRALPTPGGSMVDDVAHALAQTDLVTPMAYLTRVLGPPGAQSAPRTAVMLRSLSDLGDRFAAAMTARYRDADPLTTDLLCHSLMTGLIVLHRHWYERTGGTDDAASRELWSGLVGHLVEITRDGVSPVGATYVTTD